MTAVFNVRVTQVHYSHVIDKQFLHSAQADSEYENLFIKTIANITMVINNGITNNE